MVRFVKGLFGKRKQEPEKEPKKEQQPNQQKKKGSYFLDPDAAKTFGNIEFMRQGMGEKKESSTSSSAESQFQSQSSNQSQEAQTQRRRPDKNMDEFRNMARDLKKK